MYIGKHTIHGWYRLVRFYPGRNYCHVQAKTKFTQPSILNGLFEDFKSASLVYISVCYVSKTGDVRCKHNTLFFVVFNLVVMFHHGNINLRNPELHLPRFVPFCFAISLLPYFSPRMKFSSIHVHLNLSLCFWRCDFFGSIPTQGDIFNLYINPFLFPDPALPSENGNGS